MTDPSKIEDELDAALAALDQYPLPTMTLPDPASTPTEVAAIQREGFTPPDSAGSLTLDALEESRRPKARTVCEHCPNSVWFASATELKCYCRVMFLVTWSSQEPNQITHCDGEFLGQEES